MKTFGTISRGLIAPIISKGDDVASIAAETLLNAVAREGIELHSTDILALTESVVARAQGNYATMEQIAQDIDAKFSDDTLALVFPILSRNRFAPCLEGIAKTGKKLVVILSYPSDEVGNQLIDATLLEDSGCNPLADSFTVAEFHEKFGSTVHRFTGVDYLQYYNEIIKAHNKDSFIVLSNNAKDCLKYTKSVLTCDIHTRNHTKAILKKAGGKTVLGLDDILTAPVAGSGFNSKYGLLGSNKASDDSLKLFPENPQPIVDKVQKIVFDKTGIMIEVMVYGDGAFRDPVGKIWELADPVVSPTYTKGLSGTPNEIKLKYIADNLFPNLPKDEQAKKIAAYIADHQKKSETNINVLFSEGTTPRQLTDLIGSLCDLTSGSGDKGTPFIFIQGYFDKYQG
ncbi:MAG: coenzyme F420-0:L-glutamate ligase [Treponemataceae bacterium]